MKTIREEERGEALLRVVAQGEGYAGVILFKNAIAARMDGKDLAELWARLEVEAAKVNPGYFGISGARARFLRLFPGGFSNPEYMRRERAYKLKAKAKLDAALHLDAALTWTGDGKGARSAFGATNLLSPIESARISEVLRSPGATSFIRGAAAFAIGDIAAGIGAMQEVLKPFDIAKWTVMTYLPFLWRPDTHMFLKPQVTRDYAERIGHVFASKYSPELKVSVYESLLDVAETTRREIADLGPADLIDVQSFIWTVGKYSESDAAQIQSQAAAPDRAGSEPTS